MGIRIVTDSTADLSPQIRQQYGIEMVPLTVHFGSETFLDGVTMDSEAFWRKLRESPHHPSTAQPSPGDFLEVYRRIHAEGEEILSIHISGNLSGTVGSAQVAAQMLPEARIAVVDTRSVSMGIGMVCIEAARLAREGKPVDEIVPVIRGICDRMHIFFTIDTLEFLQRNGRIGRAQALLGGLLGIKPILQVDRDGFIAPADKVRGRSRVLPRTLELMQERVPAGRRIKVAVLHARAPADAQALLDEIGRVYEIAEHYVGEIGAVVATHGGPGTLGAAFYEV